MPTSDDTTPPPSAAEPLPRPRSARAHVSAAQPTGLQPLYTPKEAIQPAHRSS